MSESSLVYVAYPIDNNTLLQFDGVPFLRYVGQVEQVLLRHFDAHFDPGDAFSVANNANVGPSIGLINRFAAETADVVVAILPKMAMSVGVPMEIETAVNRGKLVIVISDILNSWMLARTEPNLFVIPVGEEREAESLNVLDSMLYNLDLHDYAVPKYKWAQANHGRTEFPFQLLSDDGQLPTQGHDDDAGFDLYVSQETVVPADAFVDVPFDVAAQLPRGTWGMLTGRSSTVRRRGLLVTTGVIDEGYRGPLYAGVRNLTDQPVTVAKGERIAQLIVLPNYSASLAPAKIDALDDSERGTDGFGSTGN